MRPEPTPATKRLDFWFGALFFCLLIATVPVAQTRWWPVIAAINLTVACVYTHRKNKEEER